MRDQRDTLANFRRVGAGQRDAVDPDGSGLRIVKPFRQLEDSRFACTGWAHDGNRLARLDFEREIFQRGGVQPGRVTEGDIAERQAAARRNRQFLRPLGRGNSGPFVQQFVQPAGRTCTAQQLSVNLGQCAKCARHKTPGDHECGYRASADVARGNAYGAAPHNQGDRPENEQDDDRCHQSAQKNALFGGVEGRLDCVAKPGLFALFLIERLDDFHRAQSFGYDRADVSHAVLARTRDIPHPAAEKHDRPDDQRNAEQQAHGQLGGEVEQIDRAADRHQDIAKRDRHRGPDNNFDQAGIGGHPAGDFLGTVLFIESGRQQQQVLLHLAADIRDHAFPQPADKIEPQRGANGQNTDDQQQISEPAPDFIGVAARGKTIIDDQLEPGRDRQRRTRSDQQRDKGHGHLARIFGRFCPDHLERAQCLGRLRIRIAGPLAPAKSPAPGRSLITLLKCLIRVHRAEIGCATGKIHLHGAI